MTNTRLHYYRLTLDHIDAQIERLREKRADISIEIQRINRRLYGPGEIPEMRMIERKCVKLEDVRE